MFLPQKFAPSLSLGRCRAVEGSWLAIGQGVSERPIASPEQLKARPSCGGVWPCIVSGVMFVH